MRLDVSRVLAGGEANLTGRVPRVLRIGACLCLAPTR